MTPYDGYSDYYYRDQLYIETTNYCNIRCNFCTNPLLKYPRGMMSFELFKKIIDDVADHPKMNSINLVGMGETFLNPKIFEMIDYIHEKKIECYVCTNGKWKLPEEKLPSILKLKHMHITIDAITNEVFHLSRPNTDVNAIVDNVKRIIKFKEKMKSDTPHVQWKMVLFKFNKHQMFDVIKLCQDINVDSVWICKGSAPQEFQTTLTDSEWEKLPHDYVFTSGFPQSEQSSTDEETGLNKWRYKSGEKSILDEIGCNGFTIRWDGTATPCCFDFNVTVKMGNVADESIKEMWSEKRVKTFENYIFQDRANRMANNQQILCDRCPDFVRYVKKCQSVINMVNPGRKQPIIPFAEALQHIKNENFESAETICHQILQSNPKDFNTLHLMGIIAYKKGDRKLSKHLIKQAITNVSISNSELHNNLGTILNEERKPNEASQCFTEAAKLREYAEWVNGI